MTIEQLPSGSYRIVQMYQGKRYRVTIDHKPTQKEALQLLADAMEGCEVKGSFKAAANSYNRSKENILSPSTMREYVRYPERIPKWFVDMPVSQIGQMEVQKVINELTKSKSPKYVHNIHGYISAVLGVANPSLTLKTTLPRIEKTEPYIPSKEDFKSLLEASEGTQYHIPLQLAFWGLRRGEICALQITDLDDNNVVHINKNKVKTPKGDWVIKVPKTVKSTRDVPIWKELADEIRAQGYVFNGSPNTLYQFMDKVQKRLGIEHFSPHKLRHLFASVLLDMGYDMKTIQDLGGWSGNEVVQKVYLHSLKLKDEKARKKIVDDMQDFLN